MRINELIVEEQIDEGLGAMIGKGVGALAKGVGATVGGAVGAWDAAKQGYQAGKAAVAGRTNPDDADPTLTRNQPAGTPPQGQQAAASPGPGAAPQQAAPAQQPAGVASSELDQLKATLGKLNPNQKKELAGELEKSMSAPAPQQPAAGGATPAPGATPPAGGAAPASGGTAYDPAKAAADKQAKGQADQQAAIQQMKQTQQANAQTSQADNALVAAVKAAKAKPAFQQTAQDKLTIKQGAAKGIHESKKKKKKVVAEFNSKFLGMKI